MLNRQMETQGSSFKKEGGFRETLTRVRVEAKAKQENAPECPECGRLMTKRQARNGKNAGKEFWGCTSYPECTGVRQINN